MSNGVKTGTILEPEWWDEDEPDAQAQKLMLAVQEAEAQCFEWMCDSYVYQMYASGRRLPNVYGLTATRTLSYAPGGLSSMQSFEISSDNQIAIGIETMQATVGSIKPWCHFVTTDGDWTQRTRARRKGDFIYSLMKTCGLYDELPNLARDSYTCGWGVAKRVIRKVGGKLTISMQRCVPTEVLWNRAYNLIPRGGEPIYHRTFALRSDLMREYPDFADEIATAPSAQTGNVPGLLVEVPADFVTINEGWRASPDGKMPGVHVLSVGDCILNGGKTKMDPDEPHPFEFLKAYSVGPGWQYQGLVEQTLADQLTLNQQNRIILENQRRGAQNRWLVHEKAAVDTGSLINRTAQVTKWAGDNEPKLVTYQYSPPELFQDRDATRTRILTRMGVNQFAASGAKPGGLNSGEAIREYGDHSQQRHRILQENIETFVVACGKQLAWACEKVKPEVRSPGRRGAQLLKWEDVKLPPGSYDVELAFAISSLPRTPEGLVDRANELLQMGKLDSTTYARITQNPDVNAALSPLLASMDAIEAILDGITEDGESTAPDPGLDLQTAFTMANQRYWRCIADKAPQDVLDMLIDWRDDVKRLLDAQAPPPAPPAPPAGPAPVPAGQAIPGPVPSNFPGN